MDRELCLETTKVTREHVTTMQNQDTSDEPVRVLFSQVGLTHTSFLLRISRLFTSFNHLWIIACHIRAKQ